MSQNQPIKDRTPDELWEYLCEENPQFLETEKHIGFKQDTLKRLLLLAWGCGEAHGFDLGVHTRNLQTMDRVKGIRAEVVEP